jgi:L-asparaginase / beta-aspartyl-peptidase
MRTLLLILSAAFLFNCTASKTSNSKPKIALVIHGGAGTILKENMSADLEKQYKDKLSEALDSGYSILNRGGSSLQAVEAAIVVMENSPLFNAGKGAVFNNEGKNELDASIMDGQMLFAGAVAGVRMVKNPIRGALAVMKYSPHVMLAGEGADNFARLKGLEVVDPSYFRDEKQYKNWQKQKQKEDSILRSKTEGYVSPITAEKFGTVGCVALDKKGNLAAGTSTGGMSNKRFGRVGDSPIIGAGTYADNRTCAVSCTGHGEYFIRLAIAHTVSTEIEYKKVSLKEAAEDAIFNKLTKLGGTGGLIALDANGNIAMPFNTAGMYRGYIDISGKKVIEIYK